MIDIYCKFALSFVIIIVALVLSIKEKISLGTQLVVSVLALMI